jgi:sensor c-di-GMP phosphodiesterase-like protein
MHRRSKLLMILFLAIAGVTLLFASSSWFLWNQTILAEEQQAGEMAESLGLRAERIVVDAIDRLRALDQLSAPACDATHLQAMNQAAIAQTHIKAIGYWRADQRVCGVGYVQLMELRPPKADKIYESGVIAWWPSKHTELGGIQLFLLRYGEHDIAIDPRLLLAGDPSQGRQAGLWVEGLKMAALPWEAELPSPNSVPVGLTMDYDNYRIVSRFSLGTILSIDIVAIEPIGAFMSRYWPLLAITASLVLILLVGWLAVVMRYSRHRFSLTNQLREALARGELEVEYQPLVDLATGHCVGAEALARWIRQDGEAISPDVFVPVAEDAGLVSDITSAVLRRTLADLGLLLQQEPQMRINLNLGPEDLADEAFAIELSSSLEKAGVAAGSIKLEITERSLINSDQARQRIHDLRQRGHQVAVDDFGTGYSSLSYLESFELDTLKIDKAFVDAIETDSVTCNVIAHIIEMAKSLGLDTVAEGMEKDYQVDWLIRQGVKYGQGFLFSKPLSASRFRQYYREHAASNVLPLRRVGT